ncbi:MAG: protein kinase [Defluviitaleaceae bacterium]|nr:protein kinase [Defluviitaleaceae bacterium]
MYIGEFLIIIGILGAATFVILTGYLIISYKNRKLYRLILEQETVSFEAFSTTVNKIRGSLTGESSQVSGSYSEENSSKSSPKSSPKNSYSDLDTLYLDTLYLDDDSTATIFQDSTQRTARNYEVSEDIPPDIDWRPLAGKYKFLEKLPGGGMGQIFIALRIPTENEWIVKFIPKKIGKLTQETEILKKLNHISLPSVIDVFENDDGQFLVQSFIEGVGMDQVLKNNGAMPYFKVLDWAEQLTQVLAYLHNREEQFLHLDLKPSNIMVTRDDKLVLIDFGISRRQSDAAETPFATIPYAAPEQLKGKLSEKSKKILEKRFGSLDKLPKERLQWQVDVRTDIYSLGVILFVAAVGHLPQYTNLEILKAAVPHRLYQIIVKCLQINPNHRYQSTNELLADIQQQKQRGKSKIQFSLLANRAASFAATAAVGISAFGFLMGSHLIALEAMTIMTVEPPFLTVSLYQSAELRLERILLDTGEERPLNPNNLQWEITANDIAQVDGNRIIGLNVGETTIKGTYRHNAVTMQVQVVEPMNGMVEISQWYQLGGMAAVFAGTTRRDWVDGTLATAEFVAPASLDTTANGAMYFADSGMLRRLYNGQIDTVAINPPFFTPDIVRAYGDDIFVLTDTFRDTYGRFFYALIRIRQSNTLIAAAEEIIFRQALETTIRDFFVHNGLIYFIEWDTSLNRTYLRTIEINAINAADNVATLAELPVGVSAMTMGENMIFLADREQGTILVYKTENFGDFEGNFGTSETLEISENLYQIAGTIGERAFIDGTNPLFYQPSRLRYYNNELFIWDFNVLRKISFSETNGAVTAAVSLIGRASPTYDFEIMYTTQSAEEIILPHSELMDFAVFGENIILTDPKRGVVWHMNRDFS